MAQVEVTEQSQDQNPQMEQATDEQETEPKTELHQQVIIEDSKNQRMTEEQSSPRSVLQIPTVGPSDSSSSSDNSGSCTSSTEEEKERGLVRNTSLKLQYWRNVMDALKKKSMCRFGGQRYASKKKLLRIRSADDPIDCGLLRFQKPSWRSFDLPELAAATHNFSPENLIGKGGQAEVYKGELADGEIVAVKKLIKKDKDEERKTADFLSELGIIAHIDHPNAARLLGFGVDGGLHLVLQYSPHGSLSSLLHGSREPLEWKVRYNVAVGVALGLQYLHYSCQRRIIHRDIKASNILLTQDFQPQISDFGLAKWLPDKWVHHVVFPIEGTFGYLAPEYFMHGIINEKTDVFAFGVLLLELITGRRAVDSSRQSLVLWAKPLLDSNNMKELADPRLGDAYNVVELKRVCLTASMCIHHLEKMRPDMNRVVQILKGEDGVVEWKQQSSLSGRALMLDACDMDDYTCSTYLKDLNRHRQLALE